MKRCAAWLLLIACALSVAARDRLSLNAATPGVGDCFQEPDGETINDVQRSPCNEPHTGEVIFTGSYPDSDTYPTTAEMQAYVQANCVDQVFETSTGRTFAASQDIDLGYFSPSEKGWGTGDRQMICYLVPDGGQPISTSYKAAPAAS